MTTPNTPNPNSLHASGLRRGIIATSLVTSGFIVGVGTFAYASAGNMPWHGGWHHGPKVGMIQHIVRGALENVGATTAQEDKIHDIIATTYSEFDTGNADREAMRKQVLELMKAPTVDRAAIEKLRADKIGDIDAKSKKIVGALIDAAGQLTPEQRTKLVQNAEDRMAHGGWGHPGWGRHHEQMDGHDDGDHGRNDGDRG